jgi:hypothetical protein
MSILISREVQFSDADNYNSVSGVISGNGSISINQVNGIVSLKNQPVFYGNLQNNLSYNNILSPFPPAESDTSSPGVQLVVFGAFFNSSDSDVINRGNCYNLSNGRFTAPVDGVYIIHLNTLQRPFTTGAVPPPTQQFSTIRIFKNGIDTMGNLSGGLHQNNIGFQIEKRNSKTIAIECIQNDYLEIYVWLYSNNINVNSQLVQGSSVCIWYYG